MLFDYYLRITLWNQHRNRDRLRRGWRVLLTATQEPTFRDFAFAAALTANATRIAATAAVPTVTSIGPGGSGGSGWTGWPCRTGGSFAAVVSVSVSVSLSFPRQGWRRRQQQDQEKDQRPHV
jgi:hypothetical protein